MNVRKITIKIHKWNLCVEKLEEILQKKKTETNK